MTLYDKLRNSSLDTAALGLDIREDGSPCPFAPLGSTVIGWATDDSLHFCFGAGRGETVFAVNPSAGAGSSVHAVANSFADFLGLICACGGTKLLDSAWNLSRCQFETLLKQNSLGGKQRSVLRAIQNGYHPTVIEDPYQYLTDVHRGFDYSALLFASEEHAEKYRPVPDTWEVCFKENFSGRNGTGKPGKELKIGKTFSWEGQTWHALAVYSCRGGIVMDLCAEADPEEIRSYIEKWLPLAGSELSDLQAIEMERENPLRLHAAVSLKLSGKPLPEASGCTAVWNPWGYNQAVARQLTEHYGLDREKGLIFIRRSCSWHGKSKSPLTSLQLDLQPLPEEIPGIRFETPAGDEGVTFTHPATGKDHRLTVADDTQEGFDYNFLTDIPNYYRQLVYTLSPDIPPEKVTLHDCAPNDARRVFDDSDGPVGYLVPAPQEADGQHVAVSSLHYAPRENVQWQMILKDTTRKPMTVDLFR